MLKAFLKFRDELKEHVITPNKEVSLIINGCTCWEVMLTNSLLWTTKKSFPARRLFRFMGL